jgi:hypothetical protein
MSLPTFWYQFWVADSNLVLLFSGKTSILCGLSHAKRCWNSNARYPFSGLLVDIICNGLCRVDGRSTPYCYKNITTGLCHQGGCFLDVLDWPGEFSFQRDKKTVKHLRMLPNLAECTTMRCSENLLNVLDHWRLLVKRPACDDKSLRGTKLTNDV